MACKVMKFGGSLIRNIDFEAANFAASRDNSEEKVDF